MLQMQPALHTAPVIPANIATVHAVMTVPANNLQPQKLLTTDMNVGSEEFFKF